MTIDYEEKNLKPRNDTVDILKKIVAVLVIGGAFDSIFLCEWGVSFDSKIFQEISSFHMPLFVLVSRYLFYWTRLHMISSCFSRCERIL